jgi:hypothetical protein
VVGDANSRRHRVRPGLRRFLLWIGPVLLAIAAWQIWDAIEAERVEGRTAQAFPEGLIEPQGSWEQENAARYYVAASSAVIWPGDGRFQSAGVTWGAREALATGESRPMTGSEEAFALATRNELSLDLIARARDLPFGAFRPGTEFNYRFGGLIQVAQLAGLRTLDALRAGNSAAAATALVSRVKFLRAFEAERRLFGATAMATELQGIAIDTALLLRRTRQPDIVLNELSRALDEVATGDVDRFIKGESTGRFDALRTMIDGRSWSVGGLLIRPVMRHHLAGMMQVAADARQAARLPWPDRIAAMNAVQEHRSALPEMSPFVAAWRLQLAFRDLVRRIGVGTAAARCARLVVAIERHRRLLGAFPQRLADLEWDGAREVLVDPFTGRPLQYAPMGDGYVLYSVGPDSTDGGGKIFPQLVSGRPPGTGPTPDVGVLVTVTSPSN